MNDKKQILTKLKEEFDRWEEILSGLSDEQITAPHLPAGWSIKDVLAHLWAWQQRSIARMEAALHGREPKFPSWPAEFDPEAEGQPHQLNTWLYETNREKPWSQVYSDWRAGFLRFLELGQAIPEKDLLEPGRYAWLAVHPLSLVLTASCEHHAEHRGWLLDWFDQQGNASRPQAGR
jgi:hypothetical protein